MRDTNITRKSYSKQEFNTRQFNIRLKQIDTPFSYETYMLYLIQALWDLKRCDKHEQMKYPLAMMLWFLGKIITKLDGSIRFSSLQSSTRNIWLNMSQIENVLYQVLDDFHIVPHQSDETIHFEYSSSLRLFTELLLYIKALVNETGHKLEHVMFLAIEFGKEYGLPNNPERMKALNSIRKKVVEEAKEKPPSLDMGGAGINNQMGDILTLTSEQIERLISLNIIPKENEQSYPIKRKKNDLLQQ